MATLADVKTALVMLCVSMCLASATNAMAQEPRLKNITLSGTDDRMVLSMRVEGAFTPDLIESIRKEAQAEFTFLIRLYRDRGMWLDEKLASFDLTHSLHYDQSRQVYVIYRSWATAPLVETRSFAEAQALMSTIGRIDILPLAQMQRGEGYELRAKAELSRITLPYYLHYVFYFVTLWDFETDWHSVYFIY
jgi:hypothetical protein